MLNFITHRIAYVAVLCLLLGNLQFIASFCPTRCNNIINEKQSHTQSANADGSYKGFRSVNTELTFKRGDDSSDNNGDGIFKSWKQMFSKLFTKPISDSGNRYHIRIKNVGDLPQRHVSNILNSYHRQQYFITTF